MEKLGINPTLLAFQLVNFGVIVILLNWLVFKPLSKILKERREKIEAGLAKEGEVDIRLAEIEVERQKKIAETKKEIEEMMSEAAKNAISLKDDILKEAREESEAMMVKTKEKLEAEKEEMVSQAKGQIASLAVSAVEKIFADRGAVDIKKKLNKEAIDKLWQRQRV